MTKGSQREYADHLECSESYVSRLKRQGRLVFDADGLVDFARSDALVAASRDPDKEGVSERWRIEKGSAAADIAAAGAIAAGAENPRNGMTATSSERSQQWSESGSAGRGSTGRQIDAPVASGSVAAAGVLADAPSQEGEIPARAAVQNSSVGGESAHNSSGATRGGGQGIASPAGASLIAGQLSLADAEPPDADAVGAPTGRTEEDRMLYRRRLQAQAAAAEYDQATKEIEMHERAGSLMRVSDARDRMYAYGRHVRDVWQSLESRMTPHLAAEQLATLRSEIKATLHELERRVAAESRVKREAGIVKPA